MRVKLLRALPNIPKDGRAETRVTCKWLLERTKSPGLGLQHYVHHGPGAPVGQAKQSAPT
jgi:hypothetical protein